ncbi:Os11g0453750 [Oryza sativa Japonica Group]|uniref:Os11g0453750 protein n=1 Tax=Oryza sativa subsp. japonica TaxID=39947 RepID=A0A0P0Y1R0_ORYSJ|nr:Os11g0453750 [Oryza sativa Japonica Group]
MDKSYTFNRTRTPTPYWIHHCRPSRDNGVVIDLPQVAAASIISFKPHWPDATTPKLMVAPNIEWPGLGMGSLWQPLRVV